MNETKFTPGPIRIERIDFPVPFYRLSSENCSFIGATYLENDAKLWAKAPEMFEALKECKACIASITFPNGDPACIAQSLERINILLNSIQDGGGK